MDADTETTGTHSVDVFGTVSSPRHGHGHAREVVESAPSSAAQLTRLRSRRANSVDISSRGGRQPAGPSPLGPTRQRRGGHERWDKGSLRAELDESTAIVPGLALDPRIASDVLALERRFTAASKGKSPARPLRAHAHRPRHSLPVTPNRADLSSNHASSLEPLSESDDVGGSATVGPALPSSALRSLDSIASPPEPKPKPEPPQIRIEKPSYMHILPSSEPEHESSGTDAKRTKRTSLGALFGITRRKDKEHEHPADISPTRPVPVRFDTSLTTRTIRTTYTTATAGSDDHASSSGVGASSGSRRSVSPAAIEPSAKTLARAAATRDQLAKRYRILYAGIDGGDGGSMASESASGLESGTLVEGQTNGPRINILDVVRWRTAKLEDAKRRRLDTGSSEDPIQDREAGNLVKNQTLYPQPLGDSLPEATSLSWLPYLAPVFAEERDARGEGDMSEMEVIERERGSSMTAWYILTSFIEEYIHRGDNDQAEVLQTPRPAADFRTPPSSRGKPSIDERSQVSPNTAIVQDTGTGARARSETEPGIMFGNDAGEASGSRFRIIDRALRTRSRNASVDIGAGTGMRARSGSRLSLGGIGKTGNSSFLLSGTTSEPPSPSHLPPPYARGHSRSQSSARFFSAETGEFGAGGNGSGEFGSAAQPGLGEGKSMSPSASRMNLANFLMGGATVLGLGMRRRPGATGVSKEVASGSENESGQASFDMSAALSDVELRPMFGREGWSDAENGRVKKQRWPRRKEKRAPLSDGGGGTGSRSESRSGSGHRSSRVPSLRTDARIFVPVDVQPEKEREERERISRKKREKEKEREYARKQAVVTDMPGKLDRIDARLHSFVQLASKLNSVHDQGQDVFGDMFVAIPSGVIGALSPYSPEEPDSPTTSASPTTPLDLNALDSFVRRLEGEEERTVIDTIGRSKLDASLPIQAFEVLHALERNLRDISNRLRDLHHVCESAEQERQKVKTLYERTVESVQTTYPECTQIERLLGSMVTEDMPWLPTWLPMWVRHLLETFSSQIQFLVENGLRIYGYVYQLVSLVVLVITLAPGGVLRFVGLLRRVWWAFIIAGISVVAYLMTHPPRGVGGIVEEGV